VSDSSGNLISNLPSVPKRPTVWAWYRHSAHYATFEPRAISVPSPRRPRDVDEETEQFLAVVGVARSGSSDGCGSSENEVLQGILADALLWVSSKGVDSTPHVCCISERPHIHDSFCHKMSGRPGTRLSWSSSAATDASFTATEPCC